MEMLPADRAGVAVVHHCDAAAAPLDAAEALDVDPDELARPQHWVCPEAPRWLGEQMAESLGPVAAKDPVDRARVQAELGTDSVWAIPGLEAEREHAALERSRCAPWRAVRPA